MERFAHRERAAEYLAERLFCELEKQVIAIRFTDRPR
jgi:hypothetical protein